MAKTPIKNGLDPTNPLEKKLEKVLSPLQDFIANQTVASVFLLLCALLAIVLANSPAHDWYESLLQLHVGVFAGDWTLVKSVHHWINEALMALFFFIIGLEVKREFVAGELRDISRSLPVVLSAFGGMAVPAAIFLLLNFSSHTLNGWAIPMATDTAFAVGVLFLLGSRVPGSLTAFLTALAIIDDIGATLTIALFYTETISSEFVLLAAVLIASLVIGNILGVRNPGFYFVLGSVVWLAVLQSGIHATIAGILVALTVPARPKRSASWFARRIQKLVQDFQHREQQKPSAATILADSKQHQIVERVQDTVEKVTTPLQRWERSLERPVALFVLPVFALTNAGVVIDTQSLVATFASPLGQGIILGLVLGKALGISLFCWLALRLKLGRLPENMQISHVVGIGLLAGMGFSMSIFINNLAFDSAPEIATVAKTAILLASLIAGTLGYLWLRIVSRETRA